VQFVRLKFRSADGDRYRATLTATHRPNKELEGYLPALPAELRAALQACQQLYRQLDGARIVRLSATRVNCADLREQLRDSLQTLYAELNRWLDPSAEWHGVRDGLIAYASELHREGDEVFVLLDCKDSTLNRLPWSAWELLATYYPHSEIAIAAPKDTPTLVEPQPQTDRPRVLVTVGRSDGINTKADLDAIGLLEARGAEVRYLLQPTHRELCDALWDNAGYHIFVYTGHSGSGADGHLGWLDLNDTEDSLSVAKLQEAMSAAVHRGLKLAIFNSCDGLGLAYRLAQLNLPQSLVMREPVPDIVAADFLRYFFESFAGDRSLLTSVLTARRRLEAHQNQHPGAMELPLLCLKTSAAPLKWSRLVAAPPEPAPPVWTPRRVAIAAGLAGFALGVAATVTLPPLICRSLPDLGPCAAGR